MTAADDGGEALLARISSEIARAQKRYFGKGPVQTRSYMFDDLLFVVMRGGLTIAEDTMLEFDMPALVREFRQAYQDKMNERLTGIIEDLTGRKVINYQSQVLFDPNMSIEIFVFDERGPERARVATAEGQGAGYAIGGATDADSRNARDGQGIARVRGG